MKRLLLLSLTAGLLSPIAAKTENEYTELTPINPYSYKKSSLVRWEEEGNRYINFKGTTRLNACFNDFQAEYQCSSRIWKKMINKNKITLNNKNQAIWNYEVNCNNNKFNRFGDWQNWINVRVDPTAELVSNKYCSINSWNKLPIDPTK